tara:strand:- start:929 stop:1561 length:633 start_codon:yes stop_codon:yes gene_type:complete
MKPNLIIGIVLLLLFLPLASAITINEPVNNYHYYTSLIDTNITWNNPINGNCSYSINNQHNHTIDCEPNFIIDLPYDNGTTTLSFYEDGNTASLTLFLNSNFTTNKSLLVGFLFLLPLLLTGLCWWLAYRLDGADHNPIRLFLILFGFVWVWVASNFASISARSYLHNDKLLEVLNNFNYLYGWFFWIMLLYFVIVFFKSIFESFKGDTV